MVKLEQTKEGDNRSVHVDILRRETNSSDLASNLGSMFRPQRELNDQSPTGILSKFPSVPIAPEKKLTLFALRLAILEKGASRLGALGFVWATVVLLGGFAVTLEPKDFWFVTVILVTEGTRTFSRSHELEWQRQSTTWSLSSASTYSFKALASTSHFMIRAIKGLFKSDTQQSHQQNAVDSRYPVNKALKYRTQRTWHSPDVPLLPLEGSIFLSKNVSSVFYWLQILSAVACGVLSLMRLIQQDYGHARGSETKNRMPALDWFYALALGESLMFLTERAYWTWMIEYCKLLDQVRRECDLGPFGIIPIKRFFYDSYSKCIDGSIFDGLEMDLISYGKEQLNSDSREEQLIGAQILDNFTTNNKFAPYTLRKIGTSSAMIERLIEMLNWKNSDEEEIRRFAAEIVSKLAGKKHSAIRVAGIPGAMESISSLLCVGQKKLLLYLHDQSNYNFSAFNLLGLRILKRLAREHENCWKIGNTRGLIPKIVEFTNAHAVPDSEIKIVKRSLQLVKILVCTTGQTGKMLRKEISEIVFTVSNIRNILQYGRSQVMLQYPVIHVLAIQVLASLAMDEEAREMIGNNGGLIKILLSIFFELRVREEEDSVSVEAGEALAILTLDSKNNCDRILKEREVVGRLIRSLNDDAIQVNSSRILRNLCANSSPKCFVTLKEVTAAIPTVMNATMTKKDKPLEVSIGLAAQILRFTDREGYKEKLELAGIKDTDLAKQLVDILKRYEYPEIKVPRIRRFVIELMIWMMKSEGKYIQLFKSLGADEALKSVEHTTSELESFNIFSGSVGLSRNNTTLTSLVEAAIEIMD